MVYVVRNMRNSHHVLVFVIHVAITAAAVITVVTAAIALVATAVAGETKFAGIHL